MECDLGRLHLAIEAAVARLNDQNRFAAHLAGFEIPDDTDRSEANVPETEEELDGQFRDAVIGLRAMRRSMRTPSPEAE